MLSRPPDSPILNGVRAHRRREKKNIYIRLFFFCVHVCIIPAPASSSSRVWVLWFFAVAPRRALRDRTNTRGKGRRAECRAISPGTNKNKSLLLFYLIGPVARAFPLFPSFILPVARALSPRKATVVLKKNQTAAVARAWFSPGVL